MTERPNAPVKLMITFLYYRDLAAAERFYRDVLGFELAIDQGDVAKIVAVGGGAHIGLVDETRGMNNWAEEKPVQICLRVDDVDAWHAYAREKRLANLSELFHNDRLGIRAFVFEDPEGYQVEIQSATREGA